MSARGELPRVRAARSGDGERIAATAIAAWRAGFRGIVPEWVDPARGWRPDAIEALLRGESDGDRELLVAELGDALCGVLLHGASRDADAAPGVGELIALYVDPGHWRRGVGAALVEAALDGMRGRGCSEATVWTLAESRRNLAFYEALGFQRDGATQRRASFGNPLEVRFRLPLEAPR